MTSADALFELDEWLGVVRDEHTHELVHYSGEQKDFSYVVAREGSKLKIVSNLFRADGEWLFAVWRVESRRFVKVHGDNGTFPRGHHEAVRRIVAELMARNPTTMPA